MPEMGPASPTSKTMTALFTTAVWGAEYVDRFLGYSLPTQLSKGNLGVFDSSSVYLLVSDSQSIKLITASPVYHALKEVLSVEFADIASIQAFTRDKYSTLAACQNYALACAANFDAVFFGYGDALWADGSFRAARKQIDEGYDAVFAFGYPVLDAPFKAFIDARSDAARRPAVAVEPRAFASHVYQHLHPMALANRWHSEWMTHCPSYILWDVPKQGLLLRSFHLHPVAVRIPKRSAGFHLPFRTTLDEEFVARLYRMNPRVYVCTNSDEIGVCSLAENTNCRYQMEPPRPVNVGDVATFAEGHAGMLHRELFTRSIRLVIEDPIEGRWRDAEDEAKAITSELQRRLSTPDSVLALEQPTAFAARMHRQETYQHWSNSDEVFVPIDSVDRLTPGNHFPNVQNVFAANYLKSLRHSVLGTVNSRIHVSCISILQALRITRAVRLSVMPRLPYRLQRRMLNLYCRFTGLGPSVRPLFAPKRWTILKWLRGLLRFAQ